LLLPAASLSAADQPAAVPGAAAPAIAVPAADVTPQPPTGSDNPFADGGSLETDPEVETLLHRAADLVNDGSYRDAAVLYQHVLDTSGDLLVLAVSREAAKSPAQAPERIYGPLQEHVERLLTAPNRGELLSVYRLSGDPAVQAVLESETQRLSETALRQVVQRYFVSAHGDDAAYRLGCLLLDRHDYSGARRMFAKVLHEHPDPSVPRRELLVRLAVASARAGDAHGAETALAKLREAMAAPPADLVTKVRAEIASTGSSPGVETAGWHMDLGTPARDGRMKSLPLDAAQRSPFWTEAWQARSELRAPQPTNIRVIGGGRSGPQERTQIVARWKNGGWFPAGDLLLDAGRVYVRTHAFRDPAATDTSASPGVLCLDAVTGHVVWFSRDDQGQTGSGTMGQQIIHVYDPSGIQLPGVPTTAEEIEFFGNQLGRSLTLVDGVVYHVEGRGPVGGRGGLTRVMINNQLMYGTSGHALVATDAVTGKVRWRAVGAPSRMRRPQDMAAAAQTPVSEDRAFLAPPVKAGHALLVPILRNGAVLVQALAPQDGHVLWERSLYAEPGPVARNTPIGVAIEGNEAYVATGAGLVFALDAADGRILWAARYPRDREGRPATPGLRVFGLYSRQPTEGWSRDVVIPSGGMLLVMPGDAKRILYLDRRTGELRGMLDQGDARYVLGVLGERLFVAGSRSVECYSTREPRRLWTAGHERGITGSSGRGVLTAQALYIPLGDAVALLDPQTGKPLGRIRAEITERDPVGNLVCDGTSLIATGMERTYALVDGAVYLAKLEELIRKGDVASMLSRAALRKRLGQRDATLADLRLAHQATQAETDKQAVADQLLDALLAAARQQPDKAAALLDEAGRLIATHEQLVRLDLARARRLIDLQQTPEALPMLVALALDGEDTLVSRDGDDGRCRTLASQIAVAELRQLSSRPDDSAARMLAERARTELAKIESRAAELRQQADRYAGLLLAVGNAFPGTEAGVEAACKAAEQLRVQDAVELAENVLLQLERSPHPPAAAAGSAALAELYQRIGWQEEAAAIWRRLAETATGVAIPGRPGQTADQLARQQLQGLPPPASGSRLTARRMPDPPWKQLWHTGGGYEIGLGQDLAPVSRFLEGHLLLGPSMAQQLKMIDLSTGQERWAFSIPQLSGRTSFSGRSFLSMHGWQFQGGNLARDGHVALFWSPGNILTLGLLSGRPLWQTRESETPSTYAAQQRAMYQQFRTETNMSGAGGSFFPFAVRAGLAAEAVADASGTTTRVRVRDLVSGRVLWERDFDPETVRGVSVDRRYVTIALQAGATLVVCDRSTGATLGRFPLDSPLNAQQPVNWLAVVEHGLLHIGSTGITLRRLPEGQAAWTVSTTILAIHRVELLAADVLCVTVPDTDPFSNTRGLVIDVRRGRLVAELRAEGPNGTFHDAVLTPDGRQLHFVVSDDRGQWQGRVLDLASGRVQSTLQFGPLDRPPAAKDLAAAGDLIPVAVRDPLIRQGNNAIRSSNLHTVWFFRKSDGKVLKGLQLPAQRGDGKFENVQHIKLRGQVLLIFGPAGVFAFGHDPAGPAPQFEPADPSTTIPDPNVATGQMFVVPLPAGVPGARRDIGRARISREATPVEVPEAQLKQRPRFDR
jgi:outer membrane protein assembly factor BamB